MKTTLKDLNDYLFEELERLNDDQEIENREDFEKEIKRSKAIAGIAQQLISNANTILEAQKLAYEVGKDVNIPKMLISSDSNG